ncbi:DUF2303 family protein [Albimonas pacifica]|uniref:Uncharacterized conserved protein YfdQ, DUF2303 family n=1 Tax=Albimonas pacifica TaxID=1114924 RepID=A0A1I3HJ61_9RHOB|nr:DUF2303 family protein [Albimonas pacifica]SFI35776.1 Uncharacterized conserved protein YfdQ, DUF2303 family [Albimonas pacifica]
MENDTRTLIDAAAEHVPQARLEEIALPDGALAVVTPAGATVRFEDLEKFRAAPRRVRAEVRHETPASFCAYVKAYSDKARTRVLASLENREIVAHLDWHSAGEGGASWATHRAVWPAALTPAFEAWHSVHDKPMTQREFAEFLQDRCFDALAPSAADLMEVAQNFEVIRDVKFRQAINLSTGERQFQFTEDDQTRGAVTCPKLIRLRTGVFWGCDPVEWAARLAYNMLDGKLTFRVQIVRLDELLDAEFERLVDAIAVDLPDVPVHRGRVVARA